MKQKLLAADDDNRHLASKLERTELELREKENMILEQSDRESQLRVELDEHQKRETRREREIRFLEKGFIHLRQIKFEKGTCSRQILS